MADWVTTVQAQHSLVEAYNNSIRRVLSPPPSLTGSEWSNKYRVLAGDSASEPGKYRWQRAPYQKEMLDVCTDTTHQKVVFMLAARTGKTLTMENTIGFYVHQQPSPIMYLGPDLSYVDNFSSVNLEPLFWYSKELKSLLNWDTRNKDNTKRHKKFNGGSIYLTGANSPAGLRGKTIRVLLIDEVDAFPDSSGDEGDPVALAETRTTTFQNRRKIIIASTPLLKDLSIIEREFELSDKRFFYVPCPKCSHEQTLEWKNLNYSDDESQPTYECQNPECGYNIPESRKMSMLDKGRWIATAESPIAGFHLNALYSTFQPWAELVSEWKKCKNNPRLLQRFKNTRLAETWDDSGERVTHHSLVARLEEYTAPVPDGVGVLTAGVDIQQNRIEASVWGYGADNEMWLVDVQVFEGEVSKDDVWGQLQKFILTSTYKLSTGIPIRIESVAIDSGYFSDKVYRFVEHISKLAPKTRVITIKGRNDFKSIVSDAPRQSKKYGAAFRLVGTDMAKDLLVGLLSNSEKGANYVHLPVILPTPRGHQMPLGEHRWLGVEVLEQLTSEKPKVQFKDGRRRRVWVLPPGKRNEALDCWVYSYAALRAMGLPFFNSLGERSKKLLAVEIPAEDEPVAQDTPDTLTSIKPLPPRKKKGGVTIHAPATNRRIWG